MPVFMHIPGDDDRLRVPAPEAGRAAELRVLAVLLAMPDTDALGALEMLAPEAPWLVEVMDELRDQPLDRWQGEHTRLFINGFPRTPCPPFESAYRHGHMKGTAAEELESLYARSGLESPELPADFLGVMLEYAAYLEEAEADASLRQELWQEHLDRWVLRFAEDLSAHTRLRLYRELAARLERQFGAEGRTRG